MVTTKKQLGAALHAIFMHLPLRRRLVLRDEITTATDFCKTDFDYFVDARVYKKGVRRARYRAEWYGGGGVDVGDLDYVAGLAGLAPSTLEQYINRSKRRLHTRAMTNPDPMASPQDDILTITRLPLGSE